MSLEAARAVLAGLDDRCQSVGAHFLSWLNDDGLNFAIVISRHAGTEKIAALNAEVRRGLEKINMILGTGDRVIQHEPEFQ